LQSFDKTKNEIFSTDVTFILDYLTSFCNFKQRNEGWNPRPLMFTEIFVFASYLI